jgi:hypothetical protein
MDIGQNGQAVEIVSDAFDARDPIQRGRLAGSDRTMPARRNLIDAMARLSRVKRNEIARLGRRAAAAKIPKIRRLTWQAVAEARAGRAEAIFNLDARITP